MPEPRERVHFWRPLLGCAAAAVLAAAMFGHVNGFQGWYPSLPFKWTRNPAIRFFLVYSIATAPLLNGLRIRRIHPKRAVALIAMTILLWRAMAVYAHSNPRGLQANIDSVQSFLNTSYLYDARRLFQAGGNVLTILADYPKLLPHLVLHSQKKPPGPILFYFILLNWMGGWNGPATVGLLTIALFDAISIVCVYLLADFWTNDTDASVIAAALFCLSPGFLMHYPQFDTCYPAVVCGATVLWGMYLRTGRRAYAIGLGVVVALTTFWVYNLLVWVFMLAGAAAVEASRCGRLIGSGAAASRPVGCDTASGKTGDEATAAAALAGGSFVVSRRIIGGAAIVLLLLTAFYVALYVAARFDPIATFRVALARQPVGNPQFARSFANSTPIDLLEFSAAVGWGCCTAAVLSMFPRMFSGRQGDESDRMGLPVKLLCLGQIAVVAASGLLRGETSRVWIFMMPLAAVPAATEVARWPRVWRTAFFGLSWLTAAAIAQNLT